MSNVKIYTKRMNLQQNQNKFFVIIYMATPTWKIFFKLSYLWFFIITEMRFTKVDYVHRYLGSLICGSKFMVKLSILLFNNSWAILIILKYNTNPPKLCCFHEFASNSNENIIWQTFNQSYSTVRKCSNYSIILFNFNITLIISVTLQTVTYFFTYLVMIA